MQGPPISVVLAHRDGLYLEALRRSLVNRKEIAVRGAVTVTDDRVTGVLQYQPDVAIVELAPDTTSSYHLIRDLNRQRPDMAVLALSAPSEPFAPQRAFRSGACGVLCTRAPLKKLITAIKTVARGERYGGDDRLPAEGRRLDGPHDKRISLTPREWEVLDLTADGKTSKDIGELLHISHRTAENHIESLRNKLEAPNKAALIRRAYEEGLLP